MKRSYRYRLKPNRQQRRTLGRVLETHRQLYNAALQERQEAWRMRRVSVSYVMQANQLKEIRSFDEEIAFLNYSSCQQTLRRLDKAFAAFFRRLKAGQRGGYPRYKSRRRFKSVAYVYGDGIRLKGGRLYIQNVGRVLIRLHRALPEGAQIKQSESALPLAQRQRARCKRGSRRYRELSQRIRRLHEKIARQRRDFQHKLSRRLVSQFGLIAVEKLSASGLARSMLAKSVHDAAWSQFLSFLSYKVEETGGKVVEVAARGTSQDCACCGCVVAKSLSERQHACPYCGFTVPRDVNAALNILSTASLTILLGTLLGLALLGCTASSSRQIDQAEKGWQRQAITSYRIEVLHVRSVWHAQTNVITVRDGQVAEWSGSCIPAPAEMGECTVQEIDPDDYTVAGLLATARRLIDNQPPENLEITLDPDYRFPRTIDFDIPEVVDEDNYWEVQSFEILQD